MGNTSLTKLRHSDIEELARMTHYNEVEVVERHNEFISKCPNGRMKIKQFKEIYTASFNSYAEDYAEHIFRSTDNDHNGYVDFREYLKCISITTRGNLDERLHFIFNVYDMDGNGTIDRAEMKQILSAFYSMKYSYRRWLKEETANVRTNKIFEKYDVDNDGFLSREEFIVAAKEDPYIILTDNAPNQQGSIKYRQVKPSDGGSPHQGSANTAHVTRPSSRHEMRDTPVLPPQEARQKPPHGMRESPVQQYQQRASQEIRGNQQEMRGYQHDIRGNQQEMKSYQKEMRGNQHEVRGYQQEVGGYQQEIRRNPVGAQQYSRQKPLQEIGNPVQVPHWPPQDMNRHEQKIPAHEERQAPVYDTREKYPPYWDIPSPEIEENMPMIKQTTV